MTECLDCGREVNFDIDYYQIKKNGNKTGSKSIGYLCNDCGGILEE